IRVTAAQVAARRSARRQRSRRAGKPGIGNRTGLQRTSRIHAPEISTACLICEMLQVSGRAAVGKALAEEQVAVIRCLINGCIGGEERAGKGLVASHALVGAEVNEVL